ncbi:putative ribonuclease H-like domain-containing protein [Tanacetum coccineum]
MQSTSHFGQDGLMILDWSYKADDATSISSLMAINQRSPNSQNSVGQESRTKGLGTRGETKDQFGTTSKSEYQSNSQETLVSTLSLSLKGVFILSPKFKFVDEDLATGMKLSLWHVRLGHVNFKNINKLVKGNLVRGLPSKDIHALNHYVLACRKGKQHRASCKKIEERTIREPLELLYMDLFGPVSVESVNKKKYCLVVTDDCSKFSWVFFLAYKDETSCMLHDFDCGFRKQAKDIKVQTIRIQQNGFLCQKDQRIGPSLKLLEGIRPRNVLRKEDTIVLEEQACVHDELVSLMHQGISCKAHNDDQRIAFEEERKVST